MPISRSAKRIAILVAFAAAVGAAGAKYYRPLFVNRPLTAEERGKLLTVIREPSFPDSTGFVLRDTTGPLSLEFVKGDTTSHVQPGDVITPAHVIRLRDYLKRRTGIPIASPKPTDITYRESRDTSGVPHFQFRKGVLVETREAFGNRFLRSGGRALKGVGFAEMGKPFRPIVRGRGKH